MQMHDTLLCVDDSPAVASVTADILNEAGFPAEVARDVEEALGLVDAHPNRYGLIFADHNTRPQSGITLVWQLKHRQFQGRIIIYSDNHLDQLQELYSPLGIDLLMSKPDDSRHLIWAAAEFFCAPSQAGVW